MINDHHGQRSTWQPHLDPKQIATAEELLVFLVVQQEALTRLLVEKGVFIKEEFLEMLKVVSKEMKQRI